jgi:hypothetical protein
MMSVVRTACAVVVLLGASGRAAAQGLDFTFFAGAAFPIYDELLTYRPPAPSLPDVDITVDGSPVIAANGGTVFGGALAFEWGVIGIEGRLDATGVGFDLTGARYTLRGTQPPFNGVAVRVTIPDGSFEADRIGLLSANIRVRTPGPVALIASGGLSYLPDIAVSGSVPLQVEISGIPSLPGLNPRLTLRAAPGQSENRWGINGGAGLRFGGRVAFMAEVRAFYFQNYELRFGVENGPEILDELLAGLDTVSFDPIFVNAQAGVTFRF